MLHLKTLSDPHMGINNAAGCFFIDEESLLD